MVKATSASTDNGVAFPSEDDLLNRRAIDYLKACAPDAPTFTLTTT